MSLTSFQLKHMPLKNNQIKLILDLVMILSMGNLPISSRRIPIGRSNLNDSRLCLCTRARLFQLVWRWERTWAGQGGSCRRNDSHRGICAEVEKHCLRAQYDEKHQDDPRPASSSGKVETDLMLTFSIRCIYARLSSL